MHTVRQYLILCTVTHPEKIEVNKVLSVSVFLFMLGHYIKPFNNELLYLRLHLLYASGLQKP